METETGKLFIGGISWDTIEDRLRDYFQSFGEVIEAVIMRDRVTGRARGFGFVVFADSFVAERVLRERHVIDGRTVEAKRAVPREDHHQSYSRSNASSQGSPGPARSTKKIFVGGLPSSITEIEFKKYFDQFGKITDGVVMHDHNTQRPRGFGFVTYEAEESVERALHKSFHELNGKMVEVKRAVPKESSSPGPARNQPIYGPSRVNSLINGVYGHNSVSPVGRSSHHSPVNMDRNGYSPMGLNLDSGFGSVRGSGWESGFGYGNGMNNNSYFNASPSRFFGSPFLGDLHSNVSLPNAAANRNVLGNANLDRGGILGEIWDRSRVSASGYRGGNNENNFGAIRAGNNGGNINGFTPFNFTNHISEDSFHGNDSFYSYDHPWKYLPEELDGLGSSGYEQAGVSSASVILASNSQDYKGGFLGDYIVTAR